MRPLKRLEQAELPALAMENELLRYEVTHLRGRLAAAEQTAEQAVEELRRREGEAAAAEGEGAEGAAPMEAEEEGEMDGQEAGEELDLDGVGWGRGCRRARGRAHEGLRCVGRRRHFRLTI